MSGDEGEIPSPAGTFEPVEDGHMAAEGVETPDRPWWWDALRSTSPHPPVDEVGGFDDLQDNWQGYGMRGIQKIANVDDAEAWVDLLKAVVGAVMENVERQQEDSADPNEEPIPGDEWARIEQGLEESGR